MVYQWLVVRGRAELRKENSIILLNLDPEGSAYCIFSVQDALEIAGIVTDMAKAIWDASEKTPSAAALVEGDIQSACTLSSESGELQVIAHNEQPLIAVSFDTGVTCSLNVTQAVALVQILQNMTSAINDR